MLLKEVNENLIHGLYSNVSMCITLGMVKFSLCQLLVIRKEVHVALSPGPFSDFECCMRLLKSWELA